MATTADTSKAPSRWVALGRAFGGRLRSHRTAVAFGSFGPWPDNAIVRFFLYDVNLRPLAIAGLVALYWLLPLGVAAWDGTLVRSGDVDALVAALTGLGLAPDASGKLVRAVFGDGVAANALGYLDDVTHFLFTLIMCVGAVVTATTLKGFSRAVGELQRNGIPHARAALVQRIYDGYRRHASAWGWIGMSAALGLAAAALIVFLYGWSNHTEWWGHSRHGAAGLVFAAMVGLMVSAAVWAAVLLMYGSVMLARIASLPLELKPFHRDGCNGLGPLGRQIFLLWWNAFFGSAAIYVTLRYGYLGVEKTPVVWVLALIGTLTVPTIAVLPLLASLRNVKKTQNDAIDRLSAFLDDHLHAASTAVRAGDLAEAGRVVSQIGEARNLFDIYKSTNVWPFNPKALTFIVIATIIQIVLTTHQIISLIPH